MGELNLSQLWVILHGGGQADVIGQPLPLLSIRSPSPGHLLTEFGAGHRVAQEPVISGAQVMHAHVDE